MKRKSIFYFPFILDIILLFPWIFNLISISPSIPMLLHYLILSVTILFGYKYFNISFKKNKYLLLIPSLCVIVVWHLPWFFDLATSDYLFWIPDVVTLSISGVIIGTCAKELTANQILTLFFLWMIGDSFLSYMWIIGYPLYTYPFSIYPKADFPMAGTIVFLIMDIYGIFILLKLFFTKIFLN